MTHSLTDTNKDTKLLAQAGRRGLSFRQIRHALPRLGLASLVTLCLAPSVQAAPGDLDPSFGRRGFVTTNFGGGAFNNEVVRALAIQADGKIVAGGESDTIAGFALARYKKNGSLDRRFGRRGRVTTDFGADRFAHASALAIQADGKIVVAGSVISEFEGDFNFNTDFALARYNTDGSLDSSFDGDGLVTTDFGGGTYFQDIAYALAIQADGKIVAAGSSELQFALARYNTDGSLDSSFDGDGLVTTHFGSDTYGNNVLALAIQADGKIVVAGESLSESNGKDFTLARYNTDGNLDSSFGMGGRVTTDFRNYFPTQDFGSYDVANALAIQADGRIVVGGFSSDNSLAIADFSLARYNTDGSLDTSFSDDGRVTTDFAGFDDEARALTLQADGKIVAAGSAKLNDSSTTSAFALARYNTDGSLDTSFGRRGRVTTHFDADSYDGANALALQADGKIVAAGFSNVTGSVDFALARYFASGPRR